MYEKLDPTQRGRSACRIWSRSGIYTGFFALGEWGTGGCVLRWKFGYIPPLTGKPEQQRCTMRSSVPTSISGRQRSAICSRLLPERTDFRCALCR